MEGVTAGPPFGLDNKFGESELPLLLLLLLLVVVSWLLWWVPLEADGVWPRARDPPDGGDPVWRYRKMKFSSSTYWLIFWPF